MGAKSLLKVSSIELEVGGRPSALDDKEELEALLSFVADACGVEAADDDDDDDDDEALDDKEDGESTDRLEEERDDLPDDESDDSVSDNEAAEPGR